MLRAPAARPFKFIFTVAVSPLPHTKPIRRTAYCWISKSRPLSAHLKKLIQKIILALALLATAQTQLFAQGTLIPPGAPAPMMKSLDQVEARTPISAAPFTINVSGSYYLTTNLTTTVSNAISIAASGVTLDLNGFTISSTVANSLNGGYAILLGSGLSDLTILNGHIRSGVTNSGGVYAGSGFNYGIFYSGTAPVNTRVSGVSVAGCLAYGIYLNIGDSTVVEACTVRTMGGHGIRASTIKSCVAVDCRTNAIYGDQVADSRGESTGSGYGLYASSAANDYGSSITGTGLRGGSAQNCSGYSSTGIGLDAAMAQNCYGESNGLGLQSQGTANNCWGYSSFGTAMSALNASYCTGYRPGGTAIQATIATGCIALNGTNIITYKYNMP